MDRLIKEFMAGLGYELTSYTDVPEGASWARWYEGYDKDFHDYNINRGADNNPIRCSRARLNMAKKGCERWANLLWNDDCLVALDGVTEAEAALFDAALKDNDFTAQTNRTTEKAFAMGTAAYSVYYENSPLGIKVPRIDYLTHEYIYPFAWDAQSGDITGIAFPAIKQEGDDTIISIRVVQYRPDRALWETLNYYGIADKSGIRQIEPPPHIEAEYTTANKPFEVIRPNIAGNTNTPSPFGQSIYANCIDTLKAIDLAYDGISMSLMLGRPRIAVSSRLLYYDESKTHPVFDPVDMGVYEIGDNTDDEAALVKEITPAYTADKFEMSLREQLNIFGEMVGLGDKAFRFERNAMRTATEVISDNSEMLRTMEKHQNGIRIAIERACMAVCEVMGINPKEITVKFDDSITTDKDAERRRWYDYVLAGQVSMEYYLEHYEGLSPEEAAAVAGNGRSYTAE